MNSTTTTDPAKKISPKVWAGLLTGLIVAAIGGIVAAVTPDTFAFLGAWGPIIYSLVTIGGAQLAAFLKTDPLRATSAAPAAVTNVFTPAAAPVDDVVDATVPDPVDATDAVSHISK